MAPRILNVYCIFIEPRIKGDELYVVEYPFHWDFGWPRPCSLLPPLSLYLNYFSVSIGLWVMLLVYICPPSTHIHSSIPFSFDIRDHPDQQPPQRCFVSHKSTWKFVKRASNCPGILASWTFMCCWVSGILFSHWARLPKYNIFWLDPSVSIADKWILNEPKIVLKSNQQVHEIEIR